MTTQLGKPLRYREMLKWMWPHALTRNRKHQPSQADAYDRQRNGKLLQHEGEPRRQ